MVQGFEKYRVDHHWGAIRQIIPAETRYFNLSTQWDDTDTRETAEIVKNPCVDGVLYRHNSLGYRGKDPDWKLPHTVFVGDENTKCIGVDDAHMWTTLVAENLDTKAINFGRDGASNEWIMSQAVRIIELHQPTMVVQWTDPFRYLYVDSKGKYWDFHPNREIPKSSIFSGNAPEEARKAFYTIDTMKTAIHRLMMNSILLDQLAASWDVKIVQVFSFLEQTPLAFVSPRVTGVTKTVTHDHTARDGIHCGNVGQYWVSQWVTEKLK